MSEQSSIFNDSTTYKVISAVFDRSTDAGQAVQWLRESGIPDSAISVVARPVDGVTPTASAADTTDDRPSDAEEMGKGALAGLGVGAGVGAIFGLIAAIIPGVGPFITAGALAHVLGTAGGAAAAGAIVGGTSAAIAGALSHWGLSEAESSYYAAEVERGGTYVGVDLAQAPVSSDTVREAFIRFHGRTAA